MSISARKLRCRQAVASGPYLRYVSGVRLTYNGRKTRDQLSRQETRQYDALGLRELLQNESFCNRLMTLRRESGIGEDISGLRVLDVAIWMTGGVPPTPR
jgi:hypothetical protein